MVGGNRFIARKVIQSLGRAVDRGEREAAAELRRLLERNYLRGDVAYDLVFERYHPLEKWRTGASRERRPVASFERGGA
jgi:hypothetical protein